MGILHLKTKEQALIEGLSGLRFIGMCSIVTVTEIKALKKSRITKNPTPSNLTVIKKYSYRVVSLGNEYEKAVNSRLKKENKEQDFEAKGSYCVPVSDNNILFQHKEKEQFYIRYYSNLCPTHKTATFYYDANGMEIPKEHFYKLQAEYFPLSSKNDRQGLDNEVRVNNVKIENMKWLKRGAFVHNELTQDILEKIKRVDKEREEAQEEIKRAA